MQRRLVILAAAAMLALLSVVAVIGYARGSDRRALEGKQGRWVLLATGTIPAKTSGADIRSKRLVRQVLMPAETVPSGALTKLDANLDALRLNAALQPDQMLMRGQFGPGSAPTPSPTPTFKLPSDKIAVSVVLGIGPQVAGNVKPGDNVAVFETYPREDSKEARQETELLLPKVTVITIGESPVATPSASASASPSASEEAGGGMTGGLETTTATTTTSVQILERYVVTLAVTQSEARKLILAYNAGLLHLGLLGSKAKVSLTPTPAVDEANS